MKPNLTNLTLRNALTFCLFRVTAVISDKIHSPVTRKYKMSNKCVSLRNYTVSSLYSSMESNLTVLTLRNTLIVFFRHVTAVISVKTYSPVT